jgi:hypothetical protein
LEERTVPVAAPAERRSLVDVLFALETNRDPAQLPELVRRLAELLEAPGQDSLRRAFANWLRESHLHRLGTAVEVATGELSEVTNTLAEQVKRWEEQFRQQGRRHGEAEILRRQLCRHFGPLPDWAE